MRKRSSTFFSAEFYILGVILLVGLFLRVYKLDTHMMFIGDFAWFYLEANKMIETGIIPLVGITTSQTWLHQGPLWTYLIAPILFVTKNPLGVGYFSAVIGVLTVFMTYLLGAEMFSKRLGLIASFFAATSPLVIVFSRMPYHTSPIPLVTILFLFFSYRWIKEGWSYFPFVMFAAALLYNLELATVVVIPFIAVVGYFVWRKHGLNELRSLTIVTRTAILTIIPMLPILIYDFRNEFLQTIKFAHWSIYLRAIKPLFENSSQQFSFLANSEYYFDNFNRLIFLNDSYIAFFLLLFLLGYLAFRLISNENIVESEKMIWMFVTVCFGLFLVNKTQSDAYLPLLFIPVILLFSYAFSTVFKQKSVFLFVLASFLGFVNGISLVKNNFLMEMPHGYGLTYEKKMIAVNEIKKIARTKDINLVSGNKDAVNLILPYVYLLERDGYTINTESPERFELYELLDDVNVQYKSNTIQ